MSTKYRSRCRLSVNQDRADQVSIDGIAQHSTADAFRTLSPRFLGLNTLENNYWSWKVLEIWKHQYELWSSPVNLYLKKITKS